MSIGRRIKSLLRQGGNTMNKLDIASNVVYAGLAVLGVGTAFILLVVILRSLIFGA